MLRAPYRQSSAPSRHAARQFGQPTLRSAACAPLAKAAQKGGTLDGALHALSRIQCVSVERAPAPVKTEWPTVWPTARADCAIADCPTSCTPCPSRLSPTCTDVPCMCMVLCACAPAGGCTAAMLPMNDDLLVSGTGTLALFVAVAADFFDVAPAGAAAPACDAWRWSRFSTARLTSPSASRSARAARSSAASHAD
jgi:hypothetical protein